MRPGDVPSDSFTTLPRRPYQMDPDEDAPEKPDGGGMLLLRLTGALIAAMAFVWLCWLVGKYRPQDFSILAGPVLLFRYGDVADQVCGAVGLAVFLPCLFAVGVRVNGATIALAILAAICWVCVGLFIEAVAAC